MRFGLTSEQQEFAKALDALLAASDVPTAARQWAQGDTSAGLRVWSALAELGVAGLAVPEAFTGLGATAVDVAVAFEALGYHAVPGPWVDTAVVAPAVFAALGDPLGLLPRVVAGEVTASFALPPVTPYAADAALTTHCFLVEDGMLHEAQVADTLASVDPGRHPARVVAGQPLCAVDVESVLDRAAAACAAELLGCGRRMLADAVDYVHARRQFGRAVGEYQAVKHLLADVRVALDFAAPLVHGAALALDEGAPTASRSVSAAKASASDAAYLAARTALQVHGAIGYTREYDLSLWFLRTRALIGAWGTPQWHRSRVLASLTGGGR